MRAQHGIHTLTNNYSPIAGIDAQRIQVLRVHQDNAELSELTDEKNQIIQAAGILLHTKLLTIVEELGMATETTETS